MVFFVLFLPITGRLLVVQAKEVVTKEDTSVKEVLPEIKLNVNSRELVKGKTYQLKVYNTTQEQTVSFKTSDANYVTVTDKGLIKGLELGNATITVIIKEETKVITTLQCEITVGVPALSVRITKSDVILVVGQSTTLKVLVAPYNTVEEVRFTDLGSKLFEITPGGRLKALSVGKSYVYALVENDISRCKVTVISEETYQKLGDIGITDLSTITNSEDVLSVSGSAISIQDSANSINEKANDKTSEKTIEKNTIPSMAD
jgi:hypothetical protein